MKKIASSFCIVLLLGIGLLVNIGSVSAYQAGYEIYYDYTALTQPTVDGQWTASDEWTDTISTQIAGSLHANVSLEFVSSYPDWVNQYYLIEVFDDTSLDAGDYFRMCMESPTGIGGTPIGGTSPQTDCLRIDFVGFDESGVTVYRGDGSDWVVSTDWTWQTDVNVVATVSASPRDSTPHLIIEVMIENLHFSIGTPQWLRVGVYDASNSAAGEQAWPDSSSVNAPDEWGLNNTTQDTIPEGFTFTVMVILSSISLIVGSRYLQKRARREQ